MKWKVVTTMRYHKSHPDPSKRGKVFHMDLPYTFDTQAEALRLAAGYSRINKSLGRTGVVYSVKPVLTPNPSPRRKRSAWPKGKTPPHLRK